MTSIQNPFLHGLQERRESSAKELLSQLETKLSGEGKWDAKLYVLQQEKQLLLDVLRGVTREISRAETALSRCRNALVPISRLPPTILADIFEHGLTVRHISEKTSERGRNRILEVALRTCHHWRTVALQTHSLWNYFVIEFPKPLSPWENQYLLRASKAPLDVTLLFPDPNDTPTRAKFHKWLKKVSRLMTRCRNLTVRTTANSLAALLFPISNPMPMLSSLTWYAYDDAGPEDGSVPEVTLFDGSVDHPPTINISLRGRHPKLHGCDKIYEAIRHLECEGLTEEEVKGVASLVGNCSGLRSLTWHTNLETSSTLQHPPSISSTTCEFLYVDGESVSRMLPSIQMPNLHTLLLSVTLKCIGPSLDSMHIFPRLRVLHLYLDDYPPASFLSFLSAHPTIEALATSKSPNLIKILRLMHSGSFLSRRTSKLKFLYIGLASEPMWGSSEDLCRALEDLLESSASFPDLLPLQVVLNDAVWLDKRDTMVEDFGSLASAYPQTVSFSHIDSDWLSPDVLYPLSRPFFTTD